LLTRTKHLELVRPHDNCVVRTEIDNIKQSNESISKDLSEKNDKLFKIRDHVNSRNEKIKQEIEERFHEFQIKISDLQNTYVS